MKTYKQFIAETLSESYSLKKTFSTEKSSEETGLDDGYTETSYDIHHKGKKVGELEHESYFGYVRGKLHNKDLPELSSYKGNNPQEKLHSFLGSKTGQKWSSNLHKYNK